MKTRYVWTPNGVKPEEDPLAEAWRSVWNETHCAGCETLGASPVAQGWTRVHNHNHGPAYWLCTRCSAGVLTAEQALHARGDHT